jgi:hypothetical protein
MMQLEKIDVHTPDKIFRHFYENQSPLERLEESVSYLHVIYNLLFQLPVAVLMSLRLHYIELQNQSFCHIQVVSFVAEYCDRQVFYWPNLDLLKEVFSHMRLSLVPRGLLEDDEEVCVSLYQDGYELQIP